MTDYLTPGFGLVFITPFAVIELNRSKISLVANYTPHSKDKTENRKTVFM